MALVGAALTLAACEKYEDADQFDRRTLRAVVTPEGPIEFGAAGDTLRLRAVVQDKDGRIAGDWPVEWATSDARILKIVSTTDAPEPSVLVESLGSGVAWIEATIDRQLDARDFVTFGDRPKTLVRFDLRQVRSSVHLNPSGTLLLDRLTEPAALGIEIRDRNGFPVLGAWHSTLLSLSDSSVAQLGGAGVVFLPDGGPGSTPAWRTDFYSRGSVEVRALRDGSTWIRALGPGSQADSVFVTVRQSVTGVQIDPSDPLVLTRLGEQRALSALVLDAGGEPVSAATATWQSSDPSVVTVDDRGLIRALSSGAAEIVAEVDGVTSAPLQVTVEQRAVRVRVSPRGELRLESLGEHLDLTATVEDAGGSPIPDVPITWQMDQPGVATIDESGRVTATGNGTATVRASALAPGSSSALLSPTVEIVVKQRAVTIDLEPSSPVTLTTADEGIQLSATVRDARGNAILDAPVTWLSSEPEVATVSPEGLLAGVEAGTAIITATSDEATSPEVTVTILSAALRLTSIAADSLVEGESATLLGSGFSTVPDHNHVVIEGVAATVLSATPTSLGIVVPTLDCRPARNVVVTVTVQDETTPELTHPLRPRERAALPAVGQQVVISDPLDFCFNFEDTADSEEYLVGIQSVSRNPNELIPVTFGARIAEGAAPAPIPVPALQRPGALTLHQHEFGMAPHEADWIRFKEAEARLREHEAETLHPLFNQMIGRPGAAPLMAPAAAGVPDIPTDPDLGDRFFVRVPGFGLPGANSCQDFDLIEVEVRWIGDRGIWVEDLANPSDGFNEDDFERFSDFFDDQVYPAMTAYFGEPSDLDGNGRIIAVATKEANRRGFGAFVTTADLFPRTTCPSSNQGEIYYNMVPDPLGQFGGGFGRESVVTNTLRLLPHEFTHILQFSQRLQTPGAQFFPTVWELEGQAQLSEEIMGHTLTGRSPGNNYGPEVAFNDPPTSEVGWYSGFNYMKRYFGFQSPDSRAAGAPEQCTFLGTTNAPCDWAGLYWYGVSWSLFRWLADHRGPTFPGGEAGLHQAMIRDTGEGRSSFSTLSRVLGEPIEDLLPKWAASLYVDGRIADADPLLTLPSWDLLSIFGSQPSTARLEPRAQTFSDFVESVDVRGGSTAYFLVSGDGRPATSLRALSPDGEPLPPDTRFWIVRMR